MGLRKYKQQCVCVFMVMMDHVTRCNSMTLLCFGAVLELYGTEGEDLSGFGHYLFVGVIHCWFMKPKSDLRSHIN